MFFESQGVCYVATGKQHRDEAIFNMAESAPFMQGRPSCLITDDPSSVPCGIFSQVLKHSSPVFSYRDKITGLINLPFKFTLFLDSDARIVHNVSEIFKLSVQSDLAAAHAPVRRPPGWSDPKVPLYFPELNSGVLLFKRSRLQKKLVLEWLKLYDTLKENFSQDWDQASLRSVVWKFKRERNLLLSILPQEVNLRLTKPWVAGRGLKFAIIHGRPPQNEIDSFLEFLNGDYDRFRTWAEWLSLNPDTQIRPRHDRTFC